NVYHVAPSPGKRGGDFFGGTQAMLGAWSSEVPNHYGTVAGSFDMNLVEMPAGPAGIYHVAGGCPVTIASTTAHPREAYEFATWFAMLSNEWQLRGIPASIPVIRDKYRSYLAQMFKNPDAVMNALSHPTHMEPEVGLHQSELTAAWNPILNKIASGELSAKAGAIQIATKVNAILK
ncbi:MAG TPA: hypothetical protein VFK80_05015, partial [Limnochordia bacterium]|nr:hypothetical protein [Limnochordia bacterium]